MNRRNILSVVALTAAIVPAMRRRAAAAVSSEESPKNTHRVVLQMNQDDPHLMSEVLGNVSNIVTHYSERGDDVKIEIVAHGNGFRMLRADQSPVKERIAATATRLPQVTFSACNNTKIARESEEGKEIELLPQAKLVPAGIPRIVELQEQGWHYAQP
jgi:intracellular sulfur oxidation DsrE/DsrF family protein